MLNLGAPIGKLPYNLVFRVKTLYFSDLSPGADPVWPMEGGGLIGNFWSDLYKKSIFTKNKEKCVDKSFGTLK